MRPLHAAPTTRSRSTAILERSYLPSQRRSAADSSRFRLHGHRIVFACLLVFAGHGSPARAALLIRGPSPHRALLMRLYDQMPAQFRVAGDIRLREASDSEMERLAARDCHDRSPRDSRGFTIDGYYRGDLPDGAATPVIVLWRDLYDDEDVAFVFAHEYGHFVWYRQLTYQQRAAYRSLWRKRRAAGRLVSRYAGESPEEGFAEAFAHRIRRPAILRRVDPVSSAFVAVLERSGRPASLACPLTRRTSVEANDATDDPWLRTRVPALRAGRAGGRRTLPGGTRAVRRRELQASGSRPHCAPVRTGPAGRAVCAGAFAGSPCGPARCLRCTCVPGERRGAK